jgi:hypothetical protein
MSSNAIQWYENSAFDAPELKSPQPCIHGAGCVYTKKTADGVVVPGVCGFVHPGEEGKGRRLFPERTVNDTGPDGRGKFVQPACVRLIGGAGFYERMRLRMPWQAWCAQQGIPFTPNKPGVYREPVKRVPVGNSAPVPAAVVHYMCGPNDEDFIAGATTLVRISREDAIKLGFRPAPVVAAVNCESLVWPVLSSDHIAAVPPPRVAAPPPPPPSRKATPHPVVESEAIAASAASVWRELRKTAPSDGEYDSHESDYCDNCDDCGRPVELCPERGDHGDERRELAAMANSW